MPEPSRHSYGAIIVGSGVAGMAAAELLSTHGLRVLMVDDNAHAGGQLLRRTPHARKNSGRLEPDRLKVWGLKRLDSLARGRLELSQNTQVLGIYPQRTLLVERARGRVVEVRGEAVILATGARERFLPFKGWTLPGVVSTGAAQILMKGSGILPGATPLIAGCTPLMLVLAAEILANGGRVKAVLDQSTVADKLQMVRAGAAIWPKLMEGAYYLARMAAARVPLRQAVRVVEARGNQCLASVVAARVDGQGRVLQGTESVYATDTLAVGQGFTPNIELPLQAGCRVAHAVDRGGWFVDVNADMETSQAGIYAAGETTGIAGGAKSFIEGRLAAWDILHRQGRLDANTCAQQMRPLRRRRHRQIRYGRLLNTLCHPRAGVYGDIPDAVTVCRCEGITMGEIRRHLASHVTTLDGLKKASRCGMGLCQGRTCGPILFDILSDRCGRSPQAIGVASARVPVKAVSLGALAKMKRIQGRE